MTDPIFLILSATLVLMYVGAIIKDHRAQYVWYTPAPRIINGEQVVYDRIRTQKIMAQEVERYKQLAQEKERIIKDLATKTKLVQNNQMNFLPITKHTTNGRKPTYELELGDVRYCLTFNNVFDKSCFFKHDEYVWVERVLRVGEKQRLRYDYRWVRYPKTSDDTGDQFFNPASDLPLITEFPPIWPNGKEKGEFIAEANLPFKWAVMPENNTPNFSVSNYEKLYHSAKG